MSQSITGFLTRLLISPALLGVIFYLFAILLLRRPPKRINMFYGYRTGRSMLNQDTWDEANRYCALLMRRFGQFSILLGFIAALIVTNFIAMAVVTGIISGGGAILLVFRTENHLSSLFDKNGNRR
jgi:uncharacterized membrane protein